ncbi:F-box/kelch-repeat protein At3g06240-like [Solanum verrucosum]|uniref:F-box/kelch-repeat protein At3g06240-like n=1 Tax=Solanum verrucosum TaxID=315347 RepID=UPI0020D11895|nr:F-box/kelch-repeat protein At3g06240-like [Solanum verrucosum]
MSEEATSLMDLPSPILLQILSTLPPTTLLYVKTLSKSFLNLTLDSEFTKLSRSASPASIIIHQFYSSRTASRTNTLKFLKFVVDNFDHDPIDDLDLQLYFPVDRFFLVGSVHGFVCFNNFFGDVDSIYILNPTTREYIILPEPQGVRKWPNLVTYGFGFDPVRFEYKVVRIYQEEIRDDDTNGFRYYKSEAQVYTIGKGYWRNSVEHIMFCFGCRAYGVNLYGKLHWLVSDANQNELICSFNLENELFESFPTAPGYTQENCPNLRSLGVFGSCLCVCDNNADTHFEVWVMKEYGVTDSWVKQIVINISPECNNYWLCYEMINLLKVLDDGEVLFLWRDDFLFLHHPVQKTLKRLNVCEGNFLASSHVSSSFSLKNFEAEVVNVF